MYWGCRAFTGFAAIAAYWPRASLFNCGDVRMDRGVTFRSRNSVAALSQ
jgi:hypothetical protein